MFSVCKNLREIKLPDSLEKIDNNAFYRCESLTSITIPRSVPQIGSGVFAGCNSLTIHALAGSFAEEYAKENGIPVEALD